MTFADLTVAAFFGFVAALMFWTNLVWRREARERHEAHMEDRLLRRRPAFCPQCGRDLDDPKPQLASPPDKLPAPDNDTVRAYNLLGGEQVMKRSVQDEIAAHDLIIAGFPTRVIIHLAADTQTPGLESDLAKTIGVSIRAKQGAPSDVGDAVLSPDQSNRAWQLSKTVVRATDVLGSQKAAELWLLAPAMGLDNRRPIDLLATSAGTEAVGNLLIRLDYGVYA